MANPPLMHPQEVEVLYMLPAIRKELALAMKKLNLTQKEIAKLLGVRESTISHYINEKRATKVEFSNKLKQEIKKSAEKIHTLHDSITETQRILDLARISKVTCDIHKQMAELPSKCELCELGCN